MSKGEKIWEGKERGKVVTASAPDGAFALDAAACDWMTDSPNKVVGNVVWAKVDEVAEDNDGIGGKEE